LPGIHEGTVLTGAKGHIYQAWMDAADVVRRHGNHLGDSQDHLVARLEAPYASRILRAVRDVVTDSALTGRQRADRLLALADHLGVRCGYSEATGLADDDL
jgi:hypothetical protein